MQTICNIKVDYHTTYIPGHAGIWYNETADQLAGAAEPIGPMQLHPSDVRNRMREAVRENPPPRTTGWSLSTMESADIKFGHGANQRSRGKATRIITQMVLGVISKNTLKEVFIAHGHRTLSCDATTQHNTQQTGGAVV